MNATLLIDFGSTYTKVTAVDPDAPRVLGTACAYTTVETDVENGLSRAMADLAAQTGPIAYAQRFACSSAAGGLRMIACGLVPSLTVEAARRAALGAGAKVVKVYSYELTSEDAEEIAAIAPDILLLTGGTDGGNRDNILQNARALSGVRGQFPIVVAGNRAAAAECRQTLDAAGYETIVCENVMPVFNVLNIEPVQREIRALFLRRIVQAKGLSRQQSLVDGILMPTPAAVLRALSLLSEGTEDEAGLGDLAAVDLGGATTDVYSIADGLPGEAATFLRGLPEPHAKRTVEGDIGMRYSAHGVLEAVGMAKLEAASGLPAETIERQLDRIRETPGILPAPGDPLEALDFALASLAVETGLVRHAGTIESVYTPTGMVFQQTGKDLTRVTTLVLTGGALIFGGRAEDIARRALASPDHPQSLKPRTARLLVDRRYVLAASGLLAGTAPRAALKLMKEALRDA